METQENKFNLLNGTFTGTDTQEILGTLFSDKIRFHSLKNFSHEERLGKPDLHAQERILELKKTLEDVLNFLKLQDEQKKFEVYADIKIKQVE